MKYFSVLCCYKKKISNSYQTEVFCRSGSVTEFVFQIYFFMNSSAIKPFLHSGDSILSQCDSGAQYHRKDQIWIILNGKG